MVGELSEPPRARGTASWIRLNSPCWRLRRRSSPGSTACGPGIAAHRVSQAPLYCEDEEDARQVWESAADLARTVEREWVARGERKGRTWHLSVAVYRALETSAGYVRVRGFEPLQQEQMVLAYVQAHHRITRAQATELCAITPPQANRLLRRLAAKASSSGAESDEAASTKNQRTVTDR